MKTKIKKKILKIYDLITSISYILNIKYYLILYYFKKILIII